MVIVIMIVMIVCSTSCIVIVLQTVPSDYRRCGNVLEAHIIVDVVVNAAFVVLIIVMMARIHEAATMALVVDHIHRIVIVIHHEVLVF